MTQVPLSLNSTFDRNLIYHLEAPQEFAGHGFKEGYFLSLYTSLCKEAVSNKV